MTDNEIVIQWTQSASRACGNPDQTPIPAQVLVRLAALCQLSAPVWGQFDAEGDRKHCSGSLVLFTESLVARVEFQGISVFEFESLGDDATVRVVLLPRRALKKIEMIPGEGGINSAETWQVVSAEMWPHNGRVALTYQNLDEPIVVPNRGWHGRPVEPFIASLAADLVA